MLIADYFINYSKYGIFGNSIRIDASSACQLRCPSCHQAQEENHSFIKKHLTFVNFKRFVEAHPTFKNIELSDDGEIFLNPDLEEIVQYAHSKKISLTARNGVNLNNVAEKTLECLVKYQFKILLISLDGASNEVHQIYRKGGDFEKVMTNIKIINQYKEQYRSKFPVLIWQFIVFGHNAHEISLARNMSRKLNMRFFLKLNIDPEYSPVEDSVSVREQIEHLSIAEYEEKTKTLYEFPCHQLWLAPQINPSGGLLGCCMNQEAAFGNVFESGLQQILKNEKFVYMKRMLLGLEKPREDIPCFNCRVYRKIRRQKPNLILTFFSFLGKFKDSHI